MNMQITFSIILLLLLFHFWLAIVRMEKNIIVGLSEMDENECQVKKETR